MEERTNVTFLTSINTQVRCLFLYTRLKKETSDLIQALAIYKCTFGIDCKEVEQE